jgi:hypothetical protein
LLWAIEGIVFAIDKGKERYEYIKNAIVIKSLHRAIDKFGMIKEAHTFCLVKIHDFTITDGLVN